VIGEHELKKLDERCAMTGLRKKSIKLLGMGVSCLIGKDVLKNTLNVVINLSLLRTSSSGTRNIQHHEQ